MPKTTASITRVRHLLLLSVALSPAALSVCGCGKEQSHVAARPTADEAAHEIEDTGSRISEQDFRDAAFQGSIESSRQAIKQGIDLTASDSDGRTALLLAAFEGRTEIVRLLVANDVPLDHRDGAGRTALMYAASGPNHETVSVLLDAGADPDIVDEGEGFTALMFAAAEGQQEVVRALLKHDADVTLRDIDGDTARDFAAKNGHDEVVRMLGN